MCCESCLLRAQELQYRVQGLFQGFAKESRLLDGASIPPMMSAASSAQSSLLSGLLIAAAPLAELEVEVGSESGLNSI